MELRKLNEVEFNENFHFYLHNGKRLEGITTLMKKHGLSPDYSSISDDVLKHAAELGSQAHKMIEDYCNGIAVADTSLVKSFVKLKLNIISTEYLVSDMDIVASAIDLVNYVSETEVELIDMKRTSSVHTDALSWQLGAYKYLFEMMNPTIKVVGCYCLPINKGNKDDILKDTCKPLKPIEPRSAEEIKAWFKTESEGVIYKPQNKTKEPVGLIDIIGLGNLATLKENTFKLAEIEPQVKACEEAIKEIKGMVYEYMLEHNLDCIKEGNITIKLTKPYESTKVDANALKERYPDIAEKVSKTSITKGRITINYTEQ